jgi:hypothetical protein
MATVKAEVKLNMPKILDKVTNDKFGLFLAHEWKRLINPYTPHRTGNLERNVSYKPFEITYLSPYARYQYNGKLYVDPLYDVGGFTDNGGVTWYARPNVRKKATNRPLNYLKEHNPKATDHWDVAAAKAGQQDKLYRAANKYLKTLQGGTSNA